MSADLLLCPFCGSVEVSVCLPTCTKSTPYDASHRAFPIARCLSCGASKQGNDWDHSGKSAIEAWNTRATNLELRVDAIDEGGIRHTLKIEGMTALEDGGIGVLVGFPKQIGEMKCWLHDCNTVEQCAESGCAKRVAAEDRNTTATGAA